MVCWPRMRHTARISASNTAPSILLGAVSARETPHEREKKGSMAGRLAINRLSDNAGGVKYFFATRLHPLVDKRHFALVEISAIPTKARS